MSQVIGYYVAAYDFNAEAEAELPLKSGARARPLAAAACACALTCALGCVRAAGDVIAVYNKEGEWWCVQRMRCHMRPPANRHVSGAGRDSCPMAAAVCFPPTTWSSGSPTTVAAARCSRRRARDARAIPGTTAETTDHGAAPAVPAATNGHANGHANGHGGRSAAPHEVKLDPRPPASPPPAKALSPGTSGRDALLPVGTAASGPASPKDAALAKKAEVARPGSKTKFG